LNPKTLVLDRRAGYRVFYRLVQSEDPETAELFEYLVMAFAKNKVLKADMKKLREAIKEGACTVSEWKPLSGLATPSRYRKELDSGAYIHFCLRS
jgi:hypothetical protein